MRTKHEYTQVFVKHSPSKDLAIEQAPSIFWMNPREDGGMRLTDIGFNFLTKTLNLESFSIDVRDVKFNGKFLIGLDRFVKSPYYLEIGRDGQELHYLMARHILHSQCMEMILKNLSRHIKYNVASFL